MNAVQHLNDEQKAAAPRVWRGREGYLVRVIDPNWAKRELEELHARRADRVAKEAKPLSDQTKARLAKAFTPPATPLMAILAEVADLHCVSIGEMRGRRATIKLAMARQHAIYEIRRQRGTAIGRIAHFFDRNHQTVIHALRVWPEKAAALGIPCEPIGEAR